MKYLIVLILIGVVGAEVPKCSSTAWNCVAKFIMLFADRHKTPMPEVCKGMRAASRCLDRIGDECLPVELWGDLEKSLASLSKEVSAKCGKKRNPRALLNKEESIECLKREQNYVQECVDIAKGEVMAIALISSKTERLHCNLMEYQGNCFIKRAKEKCGTAALPELVKHLIESAPVEVREFCSAAVKEIKRLAKV